MKSRLGRVLLAAALVAATLGPGVAADNPVNAHIKIDIDRTTGEVDPRLFGNFAEHLGRMIDGGIYEEGSPLSDENGFRKDVMEAVKGLGVSVLRWPGGNFSSGYDWRDGIGPKDQRPARPDLAWGGLETNHFGTDEYLQYTQMIGAEPYICANLGTGTIDEARAWVEYCNETRHTYWADLRRKNGHEQPYNVKFWELGNEIDGPWQLGHKDADDYGKFALEVAKAMKSEDHSITLIANGASNFGADWIGWNRTVLSYLKNDADYISLHTYIGNRQNDLERYLGESARIDHYIDVTKAQIAEVQPTQRNPHPIYIAYDEWNTWYRAFNDKHLEEIYNFEDALAMSVFFNSFFRHADVVKIANLAQMVNVIAPIMTNEKGLFLQPIYFPIAEYGKQRGNTSLDVWSSGPTYKLPAGQELKYLDLSASYSQKDHAIYINVLNRSKDRDITARIDNQTGKLGPGAELWEMNNDDLKATNSFEDDHKVRPSTRSVSLRIENGGFSYKFPAHSLSILKLPLQ